MVFSESACFAEITTDKSPNCVEFFHQQDVGPVLLGYSFENYVTLVVLHFPKLEPDVAEFTHEILTDVKHESSVLRLAWCPRTSMVSHPFQLIFATVCLDHTIRLFTLNNQMEVTMATIGKHNTFINDCAFEPSTGNILATTGDDNKCRIWNVSDNVSGETSEHCIPLTSPGKAVRWNGSDVGKLLVAEQNGCIRMYDATNFAPIFSLTCTPSSGLTSCDWSLVNPSKIGATIGKNFYVWDTEKGSLPQVSAPAHNEGAQTFRWCNVSEEIFSTHGRPGNETKVFLSANEKATMTITSKVGCGMSWHNILPVCVIGSNRKLLLFDLEAMS